MDWERMLASTANLKTLEDHTDYRIAKISGQLYNLITTQGIVVEEVRLLKAITKKIQEETEKLQAKGDQVKAVQKDQENQTLDEKKAQLKAKAEDFKNQKELRKKKAAEPKSPYEAAMYDVSDSLVPVQGHGLICLTRLLVERDAATLILRGLLQGAPAQPRGHLQGPQAHKRGGEVRDRLDVPHRPGRRRDRQHHEELFDA